LGGLFISLLQHPRYPGSYYRHHVTCMHSSPSLDGTEQYIRYYD
jgi:hypothetical protein